MPIPTRPVASASIATAWGQDVHDRVFAPKGCKVAGASTAVFANDGTYRDMALDSATDDPGGWLDAAGDRLVVPTNAEGLYLLTFYCTSVGGATSSYSHVFIERNGTQITRASVQNEGGTTVVLSGATVYPLVATDVLKLRSRQGNPGAAYNGTVVSFTATRIGNDWGRVMAYYPTFQKQLNGTQLGSVSCTCYAGAMVGDYHTLGTKVPTGNAVRLKTGDTSGGTTLNQVDAALNSGWAINLDTRVSSGAVSWTYFAAQITRGKAAILQGGYDPIRRSRFAGSETFKGNHAIAVLPNFVAMDPLADGRRAGIYKYHREAYPQTLLKAFASQLVVNPATGAKAGTDNVWCAFSRDNTTTWKADVEGAVYFYEVRVQPDGDWVILSRSAKRTQGIHVACSAPRIARAAPGVAIPTKSLVRLTAGVHAGVYIQASFATEVP